jgi:alpha-D-ribose 1-methylphosphonate 5-triphosphate synthase subunit PhnH
MAYRADAFTGGFTDPVLDSQSAFRGVMDAMARPGSIHRLAAQAHAPAPLGPAAAAIALTLADHDTPVFLSSALIEAGLQAWLAFHTGALVTEEREIASFAFFEPGAQVPAFSTFSPGSQDYPDRSTTLVVEITALEGGEALTLSGPGIDGRSSFAPRGLPPHFISMWADNRALYPRGVDLILAAGDRIACLPRRTAISRGEH